MTHLPYRWGGPGKEVGEDAAEVLDVLDVQSELQSHLRTHLVKPHFPAKPHGHTHGHTPCMLTATSQRSSRYLMKSSLSSRKGRERGREGRGREGGRGEGVRGKDDTGWRKKE